MEKLNRHTKRINQLLFSLQTAFIWSNSPQGEEYWNEVFENIKAMVEEKCHFDLKNKNYILVENEAEALKVLEENTYKIIIFNQSPQGKAGLVVTSSHEGKVGSNPTGDIYSQVDVTTPEKEGKEAVMSDCTSDHFFPPSLLFKQYLEYLTVLTEQLALMNKLPKESAKESCE